VTAARTLEWDWHTGAVPESVIVNETAYIETTFSFHLYRSRLAGGVQYGRGAASYLGTMFDVGPRGRVTLGEYAMVHGVRIICDAEITIGDYALISWNVVLMDTYRLPRNITERRKELELGATRELRIPGGNVSAKPIRIERNVWIATTVISILAVLGVLLLLCIYVFGNNNGSQNQSSIQPAQFISLPPQNPPGGYSTNPYNPNPYRTGPPSTPGTPRTFQV